MDELNLNGVALAPVIVALVEVSKRIGLPTEYAPWATAVLSVAAYVLILAVQSGNVSASAAGYVVNGLIYFLTSVGTYHAAKRGLGYSS